MQLGPLAASALVQQHRDLYDNIRQTLKDTGYRAGLLYIDGGAWKLQLHHAERPMVEIETDLGDRAMLMTKLQTLV